MSDYIRECRMCGEVFNLNDEDICKTCEDFIKEEEMEELKCKTH